MPSVNTNSGIKAFKGIGTAVLAVGRFDDRRVSTHAQQPLMQSLSPHNHQNNKKNIVFKSEWYGELKDAFELMMGCHILCLLPFVVCFVLITVMRVLQIHIHVLPNHNPDPKHLVDRVNSTAEAIVCFLVLVTLVSGLHALRSQSLKNLALFETQLSGLEITAESDGWQRCTRRFISKDPSWTDEGHLKAWKKGLEGQRTKKVLFRLLRVGPLVYLVALGVYLVYAPDRDSRFPRAWATIVSHVVAGDYDRFEFSVWAGFTLLILQAIVGALIGAEVFCQICYNAISAVVNEMEALSEDDMTDEESEWDSCNLGLLLTHHMKFCDEMLCFWGSREAGLAMICVLGIFLALILKSAFNFVILVAAHSDDVNHLSENFGGFFMYSAVLLSVLYKLAKITERCNSTRPGAPSIVGAMRRYVSHCFGLDTRIKLSRGEGMNTMDRHELLSASALVESRTLGVQLMGVTISYSLFANTFLKIVIYLPAGFSFMTAFFRHAQSSHNLCDYCDEISSFAPSNTSVAQQCRQHCRG